MHPTSLMQKIAIAFLWGVSMWGLEADGKIATLKDRVSPPLVKEVGTRPFNWALGLQASTPFGAWFARTAEGLKITQNIFNQLQIGSAATIEFPTKLDSPRWALGVSATFGKFHTKGFDMKLTNAGLWVSSPRLIQWPLVQGQLTPRLIVDYQGTGFDVWRAGLVRKASAQFFWLGAEMRMHFPQLASWWVATSMAFPVWTGVRVEGYQDPNVPSKPSLSPVTYSGLQGVRLQLTSGIGFLDNLRTRFGLSYILLTQSQITVQQLQPSIQLGLEF